MKDRVTNRWPIVLPLIGGVFASLVIRFFDIDRRVSSLFFDFERHEWPFVKADPWVSFYHYGTYPPLVIGVAGLVIWIFACRLWPDLETERSKALSRRGLFLGLMLLIGPGLLVNSAIKAAWARPRPLQCVEFGGDFEFRQVGDWEPQAFANSSSWTTAPPVVDFFLSAPILQSFPSGHAAIAFFLMAPAFLIDPKRNRLRAQWLCGGICYGVAMGATRVIQGGHFVSDVLWAGIIVYEIGAILDRLIQLHDGGSTVGRFTTPPVNESIGSLPAPSVQ